MGPGAAWAHPSSFFGDVAFLHFAATIRSTLGSAAPTVRGSGTPGYAAFGGALVGIAGIGMAFVNVASATSAGADADPVAIRAVATASSGQYLVAARGFATFLGAIGLSTLRSGSFPRWTGVVALVGAVAFLITFLTAVVGLGEDSMFGYGFLLGILALVVWSMATSIAAYRAVPTSTRGPAPPEAGGGLPQRRKSGRHASARHRRSRSAEGAPPRQEQFRRATLAEDLGGGSALKALVNEASTATYLVGASSN